MLFAGNLGDGQIACGGLTIAGEDGDLVAVQTPLAKQCVHFFKMTHVGSVVGLWIIPAVEQENMELWSAVARAADARARCQSQ